MIFLRKFESETHLNLDFKSEFGKYKEIREEDYQSLTNWLTLFLKRKYKINVTLELNLNSNTYICLDRIPIHDQ